MASQDLSPIINRQASAQSKKRSALGVGVTTLVTIIVVVLLTAFAVLSLVSARSNLRLSEMAVSQIQRYYEADSTATVWYAELNDFVATLEGAPQDFEGQLVAAGYQILYNEENILMVYKGFSVSEHRYLTVTIAVNDDRTTTIRQWQS